MQFKKISLSVLLSLVVTLGVNAGHNEEQGQACSQDQSQTKTIKAIKKVKKVAPPSCDQGQAQAQDCSLNQSQSQPQAQDCSLNQSQNHHQQQQQQQDCGQAATKTCTKEKKRAEKEESSSSSTSDSTTSEDESAEKNFCGEDFSGHLDHKQFKNADCSNAKFTQIANHKHHVLKRRMIRFTNCKLFNALFHDTSVRMLRFRGIDLTSTRFSNAEIGHGSCFIGAQAQYNGQTITITETQAKKIGYHFDGRIQQNTSFEQMLQQAGIN
jgi:cobalamin biosynthesis protein CobT